MSNKCDSTHLLHSVFNETGRLHLGLLIGTSDWVLIRQSLKRVGRLSGVVSTCLAAVELRGGDLAGVMSHGVIRKRDRASSGGTSDGC